MTPPLLPLNRLRRHAQRGLLALLLHAMPLMGWGYVSWLMAADLPAETPPVAAAAPADPAAASSPAQVTQAPKRPSRGQAGERHALPG